MLCGLPQEFESRKLARSEGRRYINPAVMQYQVEHLPEQLRSKVGTKGGGRGRGEGDRSMLL